MKKKWWFSQPELQALNWNPLLVNEEAEMILILEWYFFVVGGRYILVISSSCASAFFSTFG